MALNATESMSHVKAGQIKTPDNMLNMFLTHRMLGLYFLPEKKEKTCGGLYPSIVSRIYTARQRS
jgi:hypothetical protein